jgi:hypothetical protein
MELLNICTNVIYDSVYKFKKTVKAFWLEYVSLLRNVMIFRRGKVIIVSVGDSPLLWRISRESTATAMGTWHRGE